MMKKIGALVLAIMMIAVVGLAFADPATLTNGEVGGSSTFAKDKPTSQGKTINILKELTAYNVDEETINAPTITYTYAITAGSAGQGITDAATDHENNTAVHVVTKAGANPELVVMTGQGQKTGTATIAWAPTETLNANTNGAANTKTLAIDFSGVAFGAAGVYRYVITETPHAGVDTYAATGVTETTADVNKHVRYLDVYVRPVTTGFTDGSRPEDWDIYGYVCMLKNEEITDAGDTATTGAVKTNGFVAGTNGETAYLADQYYTYNVTVSKTVTNDEYAKATHAFPFTVLFTNATITQSVDISSETNGTIGGFSDPVAAALSAGTTKGIVTIKDSSFVKYIGIPNGTQVEVYETNDVTGVTYQVTTVANITGTAETHTDVAVIDHSAPTEAVAQSNQKEAYQSTKTSFAPTADADDDIVHTIAVDNNLQLISPTGVTLRVAPYILMLGAGIFLFILAHKRRKANEEA